MLDEKQQEAPVEGLKAADVVVCLQIIQRLVGAGAIQDQELAVVGAARNNLVQSLQAATGVNYDMARAAQQRALREAQERQRQMAEQAANQPAQAEPVAEVTEVDAAPAAEETAEAAE